jgi:hypothetical protein
MVQGSGFQVMGLVSVGYHGMSLSIPSPALALRVLEALDALRIFYGSTFKV